MFHMAKFCQQNSEYTLVKQLLMATKQINHEMSKDSSTH